MSVDWETEVGVPNVEFFGGPAIYYPASGAASFPVIGVFDEGYKKTEMIDGLAYTTDEGSVIGINLAQFSAQGWTAQQGDQVKITDPLSKGFGKTFMVREPRDDSHGIILLMLNLSANQL